MMLDLEPLLVDLDPQLVLFDIGFPELFIQLHTIWPLDIDLSPELGVLGVCPNQFVFEVDNFIGLLLNVAEHIFDSSMICFC